MKENLENNDWMKEAPTLAAMGRRNPFNVPDGYFENCEGAVLNLIFLDGLKQQTREHIFDVPEHYFEELTSRIETVVMLEQLKMPKQAFSVPDNYFDQLQNRIHARIETETVPKQAKVVSLWRSNLVKYASAACFLLVSFFGIYSYQNNDVKIPESRLKSTDFANEQMLYDIDESTIIEHLEAQTTSTAQTKTTSASDTEMENYILSNYSSNDLTQELKN